MSLAPAVVFTYNRADKAKKTLEALGNNYLAEQTDLYIFNDQAAAEKPNDTERVNNVREYLKSFQNSSPFHKTELIFAEQHKGLANSVIGGVTSVINQYQSVIVTEDDLVSNKNYLQYMNEALQYYKNNTAIWSISAFTYDLPSCVNRSEVYFAYRGSSLGWGTWIDRWNTVDWSMQDFSTLLLNPKRMKQLNNAGRDLYTMLRNQKKGVIDSWAVRWVFAQTKNQKLTVYPPKTMIHNIGADGEGTHHNIEVIQPFNPDESIPYELGPVKMEAEVLNEFAANFIDPYFHTHQHFHQNQLK